MKLTPKQKERKEFFERTICDAFKDDVALSFIGQQFPFYSLYARCFDKVGHLYFPDRVVSNTNYYADDEKGNDNHEKTINGVVVHTIKNNNAVGVGQRSASTDNKRTIENIINYLEDNNIVYVKYRVFANVIIVADNNTMLAFIPEGSYVITDEEYLPEWLKNCIVKRDTAGTYQYLMHTMHGFMSRDLETKDLKTDVSKNYNDDFPDARIHEILSDKNSSGLIVLHGEPGTGKSSYIRHIVNSSEYNVIYCDQSCFEYITDATFIEFLLENRNGVLILEDCEAILKDRSKTTNSMISSLLNITDGLLADATNLKIICTFNAELATIDKALLRRGRLKLKYEFKPLAKEKAQTIAKEMNLPIPNTDVTLADLYNTGQVDFTSKDRKSVGFVS